MAGDIIRMWICLFEAFIYSRRAGDEKWEIKRK